MPGESKLDDENCFPTDLLPKSLQQWTRKAKLAEPDGYPQTVPTFRELSRLCSLHKGDDAGNLLFSVPETCSDTFNEQDPFIDGYRIPKNPHNTPASRNSQLSEAESSDTECPTKLFPPSMDRQPLNSFKNTYIPKSSRSIPFGNDSKTARKPLKPPKPSFLSRYVGSSPNKVENIPPSTKAKSLESWDGGLQKATYRSLPLHSGRGSIQFLDQLATQQTREYRPSQRARQSQDPCRIIPCRYFPRALPHQDLGLLDAALNNLDLPFPAPIPTIDKLPLRHQLVGSELNETRSHVSRTAGLSASIKSHQDTSLKILRAVWYLVLLLKDLVMYTIAQASPVRESSREDLPTKRDSIPGPMATTFVGPTKVPVITCYCGAYVLQIYVAFPLPLLECMSMVDTVFREYTYPDITKMAARSIRSLVGVLIRWILAILHIKVVVELRRV
ncbi:hypothetical protein P175DRAFT_0499943 [Aspergillus ochraceoroseus IBT 24754]|uniref:Uncharacterized protein n=1 Tax=Aspergillus ochraceoroseus IBT 24754 TaxID=1392256 RepID=A0A2T5M4C8_9EURO|nr:uncharacterized protein P175DRAFT_0499943 [Aspergillus ochraceoroseus IBT 24754]PTU23393.1 hypothetical protein P175DRAFT_0499943 [Aspergillus ochraceoroseus IBT 24754]